MGFFTLFFAGALLSIPPRAQFETPPNKFVEGEGRLVTFRVVPGEKSVKLFIVGRKAADVSLGKEAKLISVTAVTKGRRERLSFTPEGDSYLISPVPDADSVLKIRAEVRGTPESVDVPMREQ